MATAALRGVSVRVIIRKMARASHCSLSFEKIRVIILLLLAVALVGVWRDVPILRMLTASPVVFAAARRLTYTTNFPLTENPVSEGGQWINGKTVGVDWSDIATSPGLACGLESGLESGSRGYDDAAALLNGKWGPDQTAEATVHSVNQNDEVYEEVELRLRSSLSAHRATGYEINFRCSKTTKAYSEIVRWNGPLGSFTYLSQRSGSQYGVTNGDVVKATIVGNVITA